MICPHCGFDDPEDPRRFPFCSDCGQPRGDVAARGSPEQSVARGPSVEPPARSLSQASTSPRLAGIDGPVSGQEYPLEQSSVSVGRQSQCDIVVADPSVSRLHARLRLTANGTEIEDAGSSNGTWVNGVRLTGPKLLGERDVVRIGNAAFEYRSPEPTGVPRGGVTIVDVIGDDPSPFPADEIPVARAPRLQPGLARQGQVQADESVAQRRPKPRLVEPLARPDGPARPGAVRSQPHSAAPSVPVGRDLEALRADLGPFTERLQRLAELLDNTPTGNGGALPAELQSLIMELEQHGGRERFARVQQLLDDLVGAPTDVRLLVRLADELPLLIRLIDFYLRALSLVRQTGE